MHFSDAGLSTAWLEIEHFNAAQRVQYVDSKITAGGTSVEGDVYQQARDAVLESLRGTVDAELADAFVGYAPVLDAVAALLSDENHVRVLNDFSGSRVRGDQVQVLIRILNDLLERESGKLAPVAEQLELPDNSAFRPDEQIAWLAADLMGGREPDLSWCPQASRAGYVERVRVFLRDHPFRVENRWASPVFGAYVAAVQFGDLHIRNELTSVGASTGLLFEFALSLGAGEIIDEWQFAALHSSVLSAEWQAVEAVVSIDSDEDVNIPASTGGELVLVEEGRTRRMAFELVLAEPGQLRILGPTAFLSVSFPGTVIVQPDQSAISLGPDCVIAGDGIRIAGETIEVLRTKQGPRDQDESDVSVSLEARGSTQL
jgi:hypothetical protein